MTSKSLFFKLQYENLRQRLWLVSFSILAFFFAFSVAAAFCINYWTKLMTDHSATLEQALQGYGSSILSTGNGAVFYLTIAFAVITAIQGFGYLFSRNKVDLYHSVPLKRNTLFFINWINGILLYIVPYIIGLIIAILMGNAYHLVNGSTISNAFILFAYHLLNYIAIYTTVIIAIMLTGNVIVALLASGVFLLYGAALYAIYYEYSIHFFKTFYSGNSENILLCYFSPATFYYGGFNEFIQSDFVFKEADAIRMLVVFISCIVLLLLATLLYRKRPSEAAGKSLTFSKSGNIIKLLLVVPASLGIGWLSQSFSSSSSDIWLILGLVIGLVLSHAIIEVIYQFDIKAAVSNKRHILVAGIFVAAIASVFRFDLAGFDSYLPSMEDVSSVAISSYSLDSDFQYYKLSKEGKFLDVDMNEYRMDQMQLTDLAPVYKLLNAAISEMATAKTSDSNASMDDTSCVISVKYNLKNGKSVFRAYTFHLIDNISVFDKIFKTDAYKKGVYPVFNDYMNQLNECTYCNPINSVELSLTPDEKKTFLKLYKKELLSQDVYDISKSSPLGYVSFANLSQEETYYSSESYALANCYIYPSFSDTIAFLEKKGIHLFDYLDINNISSVKISRYDYSEDVSSGAPSDYIEKTYQDPSSIKSIMDAAVPSSFSYSNSALKHMDDAEIMVYYKSVPTNASNNASFCFPAGDKIPDFIRKDFSIK